MKCLLSHNHKLKPSLTYVLLFLLLIESLWIFAASVKENENSKGPRTLVAKIIPTTGHKTFGLVKIQAHPKGVKIVADLENLSPGSHGFHIHTYGDLSDSSAKNVGPHFGMKTEGSEGSTHSRPADGRPIGDLQMLKAGDDGKAHMEMILHGISTSQLIGRSILVHEHEDRLVKKVWESGPKIAMGVIGIAKGE